MMGIFSKLLGSDKVISAGISGIDAMFYTDEERAEGKIKLLKAYEPFKIAQRYLALIYCVPHAFASLITFIASFWVDVSDQVELLSGNMGMIALVIVGFYFAGGVISGGFKKG